jgi:hypothetical protein
MTNDSNRSASRGTTKNDVILSLSKDLCVPGSLSGFLWKFRAFARLAEVLRQAQDDLTLDGSGDL